MATTTVRLFSNYTDGFTCGPYTCTLNTSFFPPPPPPPPPPPLPCPPPAPLLPVPDPDDLPIHLDHKSKSFLHNHAVFALTLLACIFVVSCVTTAVLVFYYRRLQRRRALGSLVDTPLFAPDPAAPAPGAGPGIDPGDSGDDPIHHVWYIRTVGLDEATIESIAVTQYKAGTGLLGSADCSVCLGDFQDGDLVRLLPKCGHAFHVPCIDTWLRAHVNCPVCRADVVDPKVPAADGESTEATSEASNRDTEETASETRENVEVSLDVESRESEGNEHEDEVFDDIPLSDSSSSGSSVLTLQTGSTERQRIREAVRHRSASVDSPFLIPSVIVTIPETGISDQVLKEAIFGEEQIGKEKERISNASKAGSTQVGPLEMVRSLSSSGSSGRSFFFSRSGRSRSSVLPL